jgi:hypothetical protein
MALARIITRSKACSRQLAFDLIARGYAVEVVTPDSLPGTVADLELRVEAGYGERLTATVVAHNGDRSSTLEFVRNLKTSAADLAALTANDLRPSDYFSHPVIEVAQPEAVPPSALLQPEYRAPATISSASDLSAGELSVSDLPAVAVLDGAPPAPLESDSTHPNFAHTDSAHKGEVLPISTSISYLPSESSTDSPLFSLEEPRLGFFSESSRITVPEPSRATLRDEAIAVSVSSVNNNQEEGNKDKSAEDVFAPLTEVPEGFLSPLNDETVLTPNLLRVANVLVATMAVLILMVFGMSLLHTRNMSAASTAPSQSTPSAPVASAVAKPAAGAKPTAKSIPRAYGRVVRPRANAMGNDIVASDTVTYLDHRFEKSAKSSKHPVTPHRDHGNGVIAANTVTYLNGASGTASQATTKSPK